VENHYPSKTQRVSIKKGHEAAVKVVWHFKVGDSSNYKVQLCFLLYLPHLDNQPKSRLKTFRVQIKNPKFLFHCDWTVILNLFEEIQPKSSNGINPRMRGIAIK
jgi:hypothetical protein